MKNLKRTSAVVLAAVFFISTVFAVFPPTAHAAAVDEFPIDGIIYKVRTESGTEGTAEVKISSISSGDVTIPETVVNGGVTYTVTSVGEAAFYSRGGITGISLPGSVTSIGAHAFFHCNSLINFSIPGNVTSIGSGAFEDCSSLTSVGIPDGVTSIEDCMFQGCSSLASISIPDSITSIGDRAFYGCSGLTSISIPDSITSIGSNMFNGCGSLTSISIPGSVASIVDFAFANCGSLTSIVFSRNTPPSFGPYVFTGVPAGLQVIVPHGAASAYTTALDGLLPADSVIFETVDKVDIVAILGVTPPATGDIPVTEITGTDQYTGTVLWSPADDSFAAGTVYTATITLTPESGYTFTGVPENFFTVAGADTVNNMASSGLITAVFPATSATPDVINIAAVPGVTPPAAGAVPVTTITETEQYTGTVHWVPADNPFNTGTAYRAIINLTAKSGYTFTGVPANFFTVAGAATVSNTANSNVITATFPPIVGVGGNFTVGGIKYKVLTQSGSTGTAEVTANSYSGVVTIPETVANGGVTYTVTSIGASAFQFCTGITSVSIPDSVASIGNNAFEYCTNLTSISIPGNVTSIGASAFNDCISLTSITFLRSIPPSFGSGVFNGARPGLQIIVPLGAVPVYTAALTGNLPANAQIVEYADTVNIAAVPGVTAPVRGAVPVTAITETQQYTGTVSWSPPSNPFAGDIVYTATITLTPKTGYTFKGVPANFFTVAGASSVSNAVNSGVITAVFPATGVGIGVAFTSGDFKFRVLTQSGTTGTAEVTNNNYSGAVVIPEAAVNGGITYTITSIGVSAFIDRTGLTSVTIPESVTSIGNTAFDGCTSLTSVSIPGSVISIGDYAFKDCTGLTSVIMQDGVSSMGQGMFWGCTSLTSVSIPGSVTYIENYAFEDCTGLTSISIPGSVTSIGNFAFLQSGLTSVTIPDSVTSIRYGAFKGCSSLESVSIPDSVISIEDDAFRDCIGLESISIPGSMTSIGTHVFYGCSGLTSVSIPGSVTSIGYGSFWGCSGLTSVSIPGSVTVIGTSAFEDCSGLTSVSIPDSVTSISNSAFRNCSGLTSVTIPDSVAGIGVSAFEGCSGLTSISIPSSMTSITDGAFKNCSGLTSVSIPGSVTLIRDYVFAGCSGLESVNIPVSVNTIGQYVFNDCSGLTSITFLRSTPADI